MIARIVIALIFSTLLSIGEASDLGKLVKQADRYQLPRPSAQSKLILGNTTITICLGKSSDERDPGLYVFGHLELKHYNGKATILTGFKELLCSPARAHRPAIRPYTITPPKPKLGGYVLDIGSLNTFATAVQCARLGDTSLAAEMVQAWQASYLKKKGIRRRVIKRYTNNHSLLLARMTYDFYFDQIIEMNANLPHCLAMLEKLAREFPQIFDPKENVTRSNYEKNFLRDLRLSVSSPPPRKDSVEAHLMTIAQKPEHYRWRAPDEAPYLIYKMGTAAIPELVRLATNQRLTPRLNVGMQYSCGNYARIGQIARETLATLCGAHQYQAKDGFDPNWNEKQWKKWHTSIDTSDEKQFFLKAMKQPANQHNKIKPWIPLWVLASKHPETLPTLTRELSKTSNPRQLIRPLYVSNLPLKQKINLLNTLYRHQHGFHRIPMVDCLALLDPKAAKQECISLLKKMPHDIKSPYWVCPQAQITKILLKIDDHELWQIYLEKIKTCAIGLQMELLASLAHCGENPPLRTRRISILKEFLNDEEIRISSDNDKRWDGPHAGFMFHKLSMQNFAAMQINSFFTLWEVPSEYWTKKQWLHYRRMISYKLTIMNKRNK